MHESHQNEIRVGVPLSTTPTTAQLAAALSSYFPRRAIEIVALEAGYLHDKTLRVGLASGRPLTIVFHRAVHSSSGEVEVLYQGKDHADFVIEFARRLSRDLQCKVLCEAFHYSPQQNDPYYWMLWENEKKPRLRPGFFCEFKGLQRCLKSFTSSVCSASPPHRI